MSISDSIRGHIISARLPAVRECYAKLGAHPVAVLALVSGIFGSSIILATPPLRGPDETAHFLRAYGIAQGDLIPTLADGLGRKGLLLPVAVAQDLVAFEDWLRTNTSSGRTGLSTVLAQMHWRQTGQEQNQKDYLFVPYGGSEGYSPIAYFPHSVAALIAQVAGFGFIPTLYLMRFAGLAFTSAIVGYGIAITPFIKWPFVAIALLPSALYGRSIINADAAAFAYSLVVIALFLRASGPLHGSTVASRCVWLVLCAMSKPANIIFILLEWLRPSRDPVWRQYRIAAMTTLPAVACFVLWTGLSGADAGTWRLVEITGVAAEQFDPGWKLRFMLSHPLHFPSAVIGMFGSMDWRELVRQLIGVLGLFDTVLRDWIYYAIAGFLTLACFVSCPARSCRALAISAFVTALAFACTIIFLLYVIWTPIAADQVWGVQGRYFVPVLPLIAIMLAGVIKNGFDVRLSALCATITAMLSGIGCLEAILRVDWIY